MKWRETMTGLDDYLFLNLFSWLIFLFRVETFGKFADATRAHLDYNRMVCNSADCNQIHWINRFPRRPHYLRAVPGPYRCQRRAASPAVYPACKPRWTPPGWSVRHCSCPSAERWTGPFSGAKASSSRASHTDSAKEKDRSFNFGWTRLMFDLWKFSTGKLRFRCQTLIVQWGSRLRVVDSGNGVRYAYYAGTQRWFIGRLTGDLCQLGEHLKWHWSLPLWFWTSRSCRCSRCYRYRTTCEEDGRQLVSLYHRRCTHKLYTTKFAKNFKKDFKRFLFPKAIEIQCQISIITDWSTLCDPVDPPRSCRALENFKKLKSPREL